MATAEIVMLAIQAGIKLGQIAQDGYVLKVKQGSLTLPLPDSYFSPDIAAAGEYFEPGGAGAGLRVHGSRLDDLCTKAAHGGLSPAEERELVEIYSDYRSRGEGQEIAEGLILGADSWDAILTVRQYTRGEVAIQRRRLAHRLVGTLVEVGVDYFATMPGGINRDSRQGKLLAAFVEALDEIPFADLDYEKEWIGDVGKRLFISVLETAAEQPELLSNDVNVQSLVKVTTKALSEATLERLKEITDAHGGDLAQKNNLKSWTELVFRSVLTSTGTEIASNPKRYLGIDSDADEALIKKVGGAVIQVVSQGGNLNFYKLVGREGLDAITRAALAAVGEHPEILGGKDDSPLRVILADVAKTLGSSDQVLVQSMVPEVFRLVLEKTGSHLDLIWPDKGKPQDHLLLVAAKETISILTARNGGNWQPAFTKPDLLKVVDAVTGELAANPNWLLARAGEVSATLEAALRASLDVLRRRGDERLGSDVAAEMLQSALRAALLRQEFLEKINGGQGAPLVAAALDAILEVIFDPTVDNAKVKWQVFRDDALKTIVDSAMRALAKSGRLADAAAAVDLIRGAMQDLLAGLAAGKALDLVSLEKWIEEKLAA